MNRFRHIIPAVPVRFAFVLISLALYLACFIGPLWTFPQLRPVLVASFPVAWLIVTYIVVGAWVHLHLSKLERVRSIPIPSSQLDQEDRL